MSSISGDPKSTIIPKLYSLIVPNHAVSNRNVESIRYMSHYVISHVFSSRSRAATSMSENAWLESTTSVQTPRSVINNEVAFCQSILVLMHLDYK